MTNNMGIKFGIKENGIVLEETLTFSSKSIERQAMFFVKKGRDIEVVVLPHLSNSTIVR